MAITVTTDLQLISDCSSTTNWSAGTVDNVDMLEGGGCLAIQVKTTTSAVVKYTFPSAVDMTGKLFIIWMKVNGKPDSKANGGFRMYVETDASNYGTWYVGGYDTAQGWTCFIIDPASTPTVPVGTINVGSVTKIGVQFKTLTSVIGSSTNNCFWDVCRYGSELRMTSAASETGGNGVGGAASFEDMYLVDAANFYGILQKKDSIYFAQGGLVLGSDTSGDIDFNDDGSILVFKDNQFVTDASNYVSFKGTSTSSNNFVHSNGAIIGAGATNPTYSVSDVDIDSASIQNVSFTRLAASNLSAATEINGCAFSGCSKLTVGSTVDFSSNSIRNSTDTGGALLWPGGTTVNNCTFSDNSRAIEVTQTTNQTYDALLFSGNTYDTHLNNGGTSINISKNNGSNPTSYIATGGGTVTYVGSSVTVKLIAQTDTGTKISGAQVFLAASAEAASGLPYDDTVTIVNSGTTATVTHTGHLMVTGDKIRIRGASLDANNGVFTITYVSADSYTYTMASSPGSNPTGTIKADFVYLYGTTDVNGEISMNRVLPTDQDVTGWARKSSSAPYYKTGAVSGTVASSSNTTYTATMISDD